ncbi:MAG: hypothetical protein M1838_005604 [Thelocarpon superellum]|nr:MAG: hypothetical protein M1838_005604 [Thelocarpon superellum]
MLHVETLHSEGVSPFQVVEAGSKTVESFVDSVQGSTATTDDGPEGGDYDYVECPDKDCGERVLVDELDTHTDMHLAEALTADGGDGAEKIEEERSRLSKRFKPGRGHRWKTSVPATAPERASRTRSPSQSERRQRSPERTGWRAIFRRRNSSPPSPSPERTVEGLRHRLGKAELGPYAYEKQMPGWLRKQIEAGAAITTLNRIGGDGKLVRVTTISNETSDLIKVLVPLCQQDPSVEWAYLSHPSVRHVGKMSREGGFCGYRNIQMMLSYIQGTRGTGHHHFPGGTPNILHLQNLIEQAWDLGFNSIGRLETGGIRGTRKYIGTSEVSGFILTS